MNCGWLSAAQARGTRARHCLQAVDPCCLASNAGSTETANQRRVVCHQPPSGSAIADLRPSAGQRNASSTAVCSPTGRVSPSRKTWGWPGDAGGTTEPSAAGSEAGAGEDPWSQNLGHLALNGPELQPRFQTTAPGWTFSHRSCFIQHRPPALHAMRFLPADGQAFARASSAVKRDGSARKAKAPIDEGTRSTAHRRARTVPDARSPDAEP